MRVPLWNCNSGRIHVTRIGDGPPRRTKGLSIHKAFGAQSLGQWDGIACVPAALAVVGAASEAGYECGVVAPDAALARELTTIDELELGRLSGRDTECRRGPDAVEFADGRSESVGESRTRMIIVALGLPPATPQAKIFDGTELVGRVDFLFEDAMTIVEFDGAIKYEGFEGREALAAEKAREDHLRQLGYEVVRLVWPDLANPGRVRALITAAFVRNNSRLRNHADLLLGTANQA